ncbi:hypothetical protein [Pedobacter gandavensis]|uniref:DUF1579 domain-containing protein n=1 Tax=Pedobacter gandavensis TaxID=2679963 RepID=A0ABR6F148_9SPHI|nr:hypothetical protein [Pedobacter gandavensis]MBB2151262.1 hypothetical protein [Pedobacter gandavensis]
MRLKIILFFLSCQTAVYAQNFKFPALPNQGKSLSDFIPKNWKILDSVSGDLNQDQVKDMAFILEYHQQIRESRAYGDNTTELITEIQKPRILAIYFKTKQGYQLAAQNNNFILRSEEGGAMGDPLRPMGIDKNQLSLSFQGGGEWRWKLKYTFGYQQKNWTLEKASNYYYNANSGELTDKQYDFVNQKMMVTTGLGKQSKAPNETITHDFKVKSLRTFESFKKPWTWEINPDEFL